MNDRAKPRNDFRLAVSVPDFAKAAVQLLRVNPMYDQPKLQDACDREPNGFVVALTSMLQRGPTLCLPESTGQNAVYLASYGFDVLAIHIDPIGLSSVSNLARERGVQLAAEQVDMSEFDMGEDQFTNVVSVFCHLPSRQRRRAHAGIVRALKPGGMFLLEAFRPEQLKYQSGGPRQLDQLMERDDVVAELEGLEMLRVGRVVRRFGEGNEQDACGAVLEILARKPLVHHPRGAVN
ncbi:MAG TPA: class I SAM-dependent methyltransferase [Polyangiaceae bacterium]